MRKIELRFLDTDIFSLLQWNHPRVVDRAQTVPPQSVFITVITEIEQLKGRFQQILTASTPDQLLLAQQRFDATKQALSQTAIVPIDNAAARKFADLLAHPRLRNLRRTDLLIAAITLSRKAILVTRNTKDFQRVPGLRLEDWTR